MSNPPKFKKSLTLVWIFFLVICIGLVIAFPDKFRPEKIAEFVSQFKNIVLLVYLISSILRGFTLVPSTPFLLAGTILLPENPFMVLAISLTGIVFSSSMIYHFSHYLGFGSVLEAKYPEKLVSIKGRLQQPTGFLFVFLWAFFPLVPTDVVCYAAGILRMNFWKFILAAGLGELVICSIYVFFYSSVIRPIL